MSNLKLPTAIIIMCALAIASNSAAEELSPLPDVMPLDANIADVDSGANKTFNSNGSVNENTDSENRAETHETLTWPMLPGESIKDTAKQFYPKNKQQQQIFINKTLILNADNNEGMKADTVFDEAKLVNIPSLKSLSKKSYGIKHKPKKKTMQLSYSIKDAVEGVPAFLIRQYEELLAKNSFLKTEIDKLNKKIEFLQNKIIDIKLVLDKTLSFSTSSNGMPVAAATKLAKPTAEQTLTSTPSAPAHNLDVTLVPNDTTAANATGAKKVFKNLDADKLAVKPVNATLQNIPVEATPPTFLEENKNNLIIALGALGLLGAISFALRKYRQRMFKNLSNVMPNMSDTVTDFGGYWQDTEMDVKDPAEQKEPSFKPGFVNTEMRVTQNKVASSLEEAKLLMSVNRSQDAIAHLKATIEAHPKSSINSWLYLLEVFRKLNFKQDFENYALQLHNTFNVMTPVWYETDSTLYVPQHLEEFPHIMEKLYASWPSDMSKEYLRGLIMDNRGGDRAGFSKSALSEILMLISVLDNRQL